MTRQNSRVLYTIGHSNHTAEDFITLLKRYNITAVADVRSAPYSRYCPQFNKDTLAETLKRNGIVYVFLGEELGVRHQDSSCYEGGHANFQQIAKQPGFKHGLARVLEGMDRYRIALMCAEKDPLECHRTILVCRNLRQQNRCIKHILYDGSIEDHHDTEQRLLKLLRIEPNLFDPETTDSARIEMAYNQQAGNIAYQSANNTKRKYHGSAR